MIGFFVPYSCRRLIEAVIFVSRITNFFDTLEYRKGWSTAIILGLFYLIDKYPISKFGYGSIAEMEAVLLKTKSGIYSRKQSENILYQPVLHVKSAYPIVARKS
tara:strand:+ start:696 stop:1007 length:312 start_codon:yes stop_codon:yes gene_type:complete